MGNIKPSFERKIKKMTDEQVEDYIDNLFANINSTNLPQALAIENQMKLINKIRAY